MAQPDKLFYSLQHTLSQICVSVSTVPLHFLNFKSSVTQVTELQVTALSTECTGGTRGDHILHKHLTTLNKKPITLPPFLNKPSNQIQHGFSSQGLKLSRIPNRDS